MLHVLYHALLDTLKIVPIIFVAYVIIEYFETQEAKNARLKKALQSRFSPLFGSLIGVIPQCGFSVVATKLYQNGYIYLGTLLAVYFATSDEAIPILFSYALTNPELGLKLLLLISIKVVYGTVIGFVINFIVKKFARAEQLEIQEAVDEQDHDHGCCGHDISEKRNGFKQFIVHPAIHSLKISLYIFIVNVALGWIIDVAIGEEVFYNALKQSIYIQPLVSVFIGFIPNCASSVFLSELFASGALSFSATLAGLTANSGLGLIVLLKDRKNIKSTLKIMALIFVLCIALGYVTLVISGGR